MADWHLCFTKRQGMKAIGKSRTDSCRTERAAGECMCNAVFMEYETVCGKRSAITRSLNGWKGSRKGFADAGERDAYLAALVDVIDGISFEIYEKYRELITVYKHVLKEALAEEKRRLNFLMRY